MSRRSRSRTWTILIRCCEVIALFVCVSCHRAATTAVTDEQSSEIAAVLERSEQPRLELGGSAPSTHEHELRSASLWRGDGFMPEPGLRTPVGFEPAHRR